MLTAKIKKLHEDSIIPTLGDEEAAAYDLYAYLPFPRTVTLQPGETRTIPTGVSITPPENYFGAIFPRSGLATKQGLGLANGVGVADFSYTGEYMVALHNHSSEERVIENGQRIAQLVFLPYVHVKWKEVDKLEETERGNGGFGHTGK